MQNPLGQQEYLNVGQKSATEFQPPAAIGGLVNRAAAQSRYYDIEPLPGEFGPWRPDHLSKWCDVLSSVRQIISHYFDVYFLLHDLHTTFLFSWFSLPITDLLFLIGVGRLGVDEVPVSHLPK